MEAAVGGGGLESKIADRNLNMQFVKTGVDSGEAWRYYSGLGSPCSATARRKHCPV